MFVIKKSHFFYLLFDYMKKIIIIFVTLVLKLKFSSIYLIKSKKLSLNINVCHDEYKF